MLEFFDWSATGINQTGQENFYCNFLMTSYDSSGVPNTAKKTGGGTQICEYFQSIKLKMLKWSHC